MTLKQQTEEQDNDEREDQGEGFPGCKTTATGDALRQADVAWASGLAPSVSEAPFVLVSESTGQAAVVLETLGPAVVGWPLRAVECPTGVALLYAAEVPRLEMILVEGPFFRSLSISCHVLGGASRGRFGLGLGLAAPLRFSDAGWANVPVDVVYFAELGTVPLRATFGAGGGRWRLRRAPGEHPYT